jgi:HK97 family phage major capsid protein
MGKLQIPQTVAGLREILNTPAKCAEWIKSERFSDLIDAYREATLAGDLAEHGVNRPAMGVPGGNDVLDARRIFEAKTASWAGVPGRALDGAFPNFGSFVRAITPRALATHGLPDAIRNLSSVDPSAGGFLVPEGFRSDMLMLALGESIVRPRATVIPMVSAKQVVPAIDSTTNVGSVFGGVDGQWIEEGATFTDSGPRFGRIVLTSCKLGLRTDVPSELLSDTSPALDVLLQRMFAAALAFEEDGAFINGNGTGQPLGFLHGPALVTVTKETDQPNDTICVENLHAMFARILSRSRTRAVWVASDSTIPELLSLSISIGIGGTYVPVLNEVNGEFRLLGRPIFFTEHCPVLGDAGDISLCDFAYYLVGDRGEMRLESSEHVKFLSDEVVFRGIERVDGRPWLLSAITPRNGGASQSAFVALGART